MPKSALPEALPMPRGITVTRVSPTAISIVRRWRLHAFSILVFAAWLGIRSS